MTKTFCDRCGQEARINQILLLVLKSDGQGWIYGPVDLCTLCCYALARWVAQKATEGV